jgi:hypothetical protein
VANDLTGNPLKLDSAAATVLLTQVFNPTMAVWVGATAGHDLVLQDKSASPKLTIKAITASDIIPFPPAFLMQGLVAATLGSGTLWLYFSDPWPRS